MLGQQLRRTFTEYEAAREKLLEKGHLPFSLYYRAHTAMQHMGKIPGKAPLNVSGTAEDIRQKLFEFHQQLMKQLLDPVNAASRKHGPRSPVVPEPTTWLNTGLAIPPPAHANDY
jgi:hypothetical protein